MYICNVSFLKRWRGADGPWTSWTDWLMDRGGTSLLQSVGEKVTWVSTESRCSPPGEWRPDMVVQAKMSGKPAEISDYIGRYQSVSPAAGSICLGAGRERQWVAGIIKVGGGTVARLV